MQEYFLTNFPITYNSLVIENTTRCTAKCGMCYQSAGPRGSDMLGDDQLSVDVIRRVLREAVNISTLKRRFHLAGGEAFLNIASCIECFEEARNLGYFEISTTTNAYWAKDVEKANKTCQDLRRAGLNRMEISWDAWHVEFISSQTVSNCIRAAYDNNIEVVLRLLSTKKETTQSAIEMLEPDAVACVDSIFCSPVIHTGRAVSTIPKSDIFNSGNLGASCHSMLSLTVNASGDVFPCCAGFDQTNTLNLGNVKETSIVDIAENMNNSLLIRFLVFSGAGSLVPILEDAGIDVGREFTSLCSMCWNIFSNPEMVYTLQNFFNKFEEKRELHKISDLENS